MPYAEIVDFAAGADLLLNISGMLADERLLERIPTRAFLDLDPGFNQVWQPRRGGHGVRPPHPLRHRRAAAGRPPGCRVPDLRAATGSRPCRRWRSTIGPTLAAPASGRLHHDRALAQLRLDRARGRRIRPARPLAARAGRAAASRRRRLSSSRSGSIPTRRTTFEALRAPRLAPRRPRSGRRARRTSTRRYVRGSFGRAGSRQERLRQLAQWLVQRSQRLLPGQRPPGRRPGDRLRGGAAGRRGPALLRDRGRGGRRRRGGQVAPRAPPGKRARARRGPARRSQGALEAPGRACVQPARPLLSSSRSS